MSAAATTLYLPEILAFHRADVARRKQAADMPALERAAAAHAPRGFAATLRSRSRADEIAVIAELKKASPSKGMIREDFDVHALAAVLSDAGAACLSVLTDEPHFRGSLHNLKLASGATTVPCLRKDFMVDEFQMLEARAHGADAVLLIVAALTDAELRALRAAARAHALDVVCEVHDEEELERARVLDCECIGVNARDLRTFEVSLERAVEIAAMIPRDAVRVAESGLRAAADVRRMRAAGYDAFLIGETLMRAHKPGVALRQLIADAR